MRALKKNLDGVKITRRLRMQKFRHMEKDKNYDMIKK